MINGEKNSNINKLILSCFNEHFEKLSFDILTCHAYEFSYFSALCPRFNIRCLVPCSDI